MTYVCTTAIQSPFSLSLSLLLCGARSSFTHASITKELKLSSLGHVQSRYLILPLAFSVSLSLSLFPLLVHPSHDLEYRRASRWSNIFLLSPADLTIHPHNRQGSAIVCSIAHTEEPLERPCAIDTSFFSKNRRKQQATSPLPPQVIIQH